MDNFEKAVAVSLNTLWGCIEVEVNKDSQVLAGRSGSSIAEDVILDAMESLNAAQLAKLKQAVDSDLITDENPYRFYGFRFRPKDGNKEANSRSIEDIIVRIELDGEVFDAYVNIKVSNGKKGQADNSCSWRAASYALYGDISVSRRDTFLNIKKDFSDEELHNYFFWVLLKNATATELRNGHVNSLLSIDPNVGLRFNINQPFPVQVVHSVNTETSHTLKSLLQRRKIFHSWLTTRMATAYNKNLNSVYNSITTNPSTENLQEYLALQKQEADKASMLNSLINGLKIKTLEEELSRSKIQFDSVVLDEETSIIQVYFEGKLILRKHIDEIG